MKRDFFNSLQEQLEQASDSGHGPLRRRWRALRRALRAHWLRGLGAGALLLAGTGLAATLWSGPAASSRAVVAARSAAAASPVASSPATSNASAAGPAASSADTDYAVATGSLDARTTPASAVAGGTELSAGSAVPADFQPTSFTAIGEFRWWLLGSASCGSGHCTTLVRTVNGGYSFVRLGLPAAASATGVRFADLNDGYLFGERVYSTHDGGEHWTATPLQGKLESMQTAGGYVYVLLARGQRGQLWRSPVSSDEWRRLTGTGNPQTLWVQGATVLLDSQPDGAAAPRLRVSTDGGTNFGFSSAIPQAWDETGCQFDQTADGVIWGACGNGSYWQLWRRDGLAGNFVSADGNTLTKPLLVSPQLAAATGSTAVLSSLSSRALWRTTDGGRQWREVRQLSLPSGYQLWRVTYLGFTDSTHGVALVTLAGGGAGGQRATSTHSALLYTVDGGASYHYVPIHN